MYDDAVDSFFLRDWLQRRASIPKLLSEILMAVRGQWKSENSMHSAANRSGGQLMLPPIRISQWIMKEKYLLPSTLDIVPLALTVLLLLIEPHKLVFSFL